MPCWHDEQKQKHQQPQPQPQPQQQQQFGLNQQSYCQLRVCAKCKRGLGRSKFSNNQWIKDKLISRCQDCIRKRNVAIPKNRYHMVSPDNTTRPEFENIFSNACFGTVRKVLYEHEILRVAAQLYGTEEMKVHLGLEPLPKDTMKKYGELRRFCIQFILHTTDLVNILQLVWMQLSTSVLAT